MGHSGPEIGWGVALAWGAGRDTPLGKRALREDLGKRPHRVQDQLGRQDDSGVRTGGGAEVQLGGHEVGGTYCLLG